MQRDELSYPRENARTLRYTLGRPRTATITADGQRVLFVRSPSGTDRRGDLWCLDVTSGKERQLVNAAELIADDERLSPQERARRERMRESAGGVVAYSVDDAGAAAVFALSGRLFDVDVESGHTRELPSGPSVVDPRIDPSGRRVAYASQGELRLHDLGTGKDVCLAAPDGDEVVWGLADFVAAEELDRSRGFWWSPDGSRLLVERFDEGNVAVRWVSDPASPENEPVPHRYPAAGTDNPAVSLWLVDLDGSRREVRWDAATFEYLASVHWSARGRALVQVLNRRQDHAAVLAVESDGTTSLVREQVDPCWVDVVAGVPTWSPDGSLLTVEVAGNRYALCVDGEPVTPDGLQVRGVLGVEDDAVVLSASEDPSDLHVWRWTAGGMRQLSSGPGVHTAETGSGTMVLLSATLDEPLPVMSVSRDGATHVVKSLAVTPSIQPQPDIFEAGDLTVALLLPRDHQPGTKLPVLLDPYGGPHFRVVLRSQAAFRESQWFADQGFAVVVCDGRGTPRDPAWERTVRFDLAGPVLADQVTALHAAKERCADLDLSRVGIRGWSFGGYLSALAVLRRPDVFHAAVAGAPVTDLALYDTAYTERYLGLPQEHPEAYQRCSLLPLASSLRRPLMLIHGFADDNVLMAHTLQLSGRLMAAGRPHTVLPLSGVTHMTPQEEVAENLLLLQVQFLRDATRGQVAAEATAAPVT